jgi:hypothetical protein
MIFFFREYVEDLDVYNYSLFAQSQINITERINFSIIIPEIFFLDKFCSSLPQIFDDNRFFVVFFIFFLRMLYAQSSKIDAICFTSVDAVNS